MGNLGFGSFMKHFSHLITKNEGPFLSSYRLSDNEETIRNYMRDILNILTGGKNGKISMFEIPGIYDELLSSTHGSNNRLNYIRKMYKNCGEFNHLAVQNMCKKIDDLKECFEVTFNCEFYSNFTLGIEELLKIMKYSIQAPVYSDDIDEVTEVYGDLSFLQYNNLTNFGNFGLKMMANNPYSRILQCQFQAIPVQIHPSRCYPFYRSITNFGFGYSFNTANFWSLFKYSKFTVNFAKIMQPKGYDKPSEPTPDGSDYPKSIKLAKSSGHKNGLRIILQRENIPRRDPGEMKQPFNIAIHDPLSVPDLRRSAFKVKPGIVNIS